MSQLQMWRGSRKSKGFLLATALPPANLHAPQASCWVLKVCVVYLAGAFKGQELHLLSSNNAGRRVEMLMTGNVLVVEDLHKVLVHASVNSMTIRNQSN